MHGSGDDDNDDGYESLDNHGCGVLEEKVGVRIFSNQNAEFMVDRFGFTGFLVYIANECLMSTQTSVCLHRRNLMADMAQALPSLPSTAVRDVGMRFVGPTERTIYE